MTRSVMLTIATLLALSVAPHLARPDLLPALEDSGECGIAPSQNRIYRIKGGRRGSALSFFEPGGRFALFRITQEDVERLAAEVTRLKQNKCYEVCVRPRVTGPGVNQAAANCDLVFIVVHGSKTLPYLTVGGRPQLQITSGPSSIRASSIWIGACYGQEITSRLNAPGGKRYRTMPKNRFDPDGTSGRQAMIQELTAELAKLQDQQCELPKRVCILSGIQEIMSE